MCLYICYDSCMANDLKAWYKEYSPMVFRRCWWILSSKTYREALRSGNFANAPDDVKDAVQEVFLKLIEVKKTIDFPSTYIYTIATNVCRNKLKKKDSEPLLLPDDFVDNNYEKAEYKQDEEAIRAILEGEDKRTRDICNMYYFEKKKVKDIVKAVGLEKSQVYNIINDFSNKVCSKLESIHLERINK